MLVGFSKHGKGAGGQAVQYLCKHEGREGNEPVILAGDAELVQERIDQSHHVWKYTSGVLSFAPEDGVISHEDEQALIAEFEEVAFAGIEAENRPQGLWVRHSHAGHHEMHFLYPRALNDGRAYNISPPGDKEHWRAFRDVWNHSNGWADPDDPERAKAVTLPNHLLKVMAQEKRQGKDRKEDIRETVHAWAARRIEAGIIENRDALIEQLKEEGFDVPRQGKDYITISAGDERVRCKGGIFSESFSSTESFAAQKGDRSRHSGEGRDSRIREAQERLARYNEKRGRFNQERYKRITSAIQEGLAPELLDRIIRQCDDLGELCDRAMGMGRDADTQSHQRQRDIGEGTSHDSSGERASKRSGLDVGQWHNMVSGAKSETGSIYLAGQGRVFYQGNGNRGEIEHDDDEYAQRERVDATGAWLDSTMSEVDAVCGDIDAFIQAERTEAEKRESAITRTVARAREAGKRLMQGYERVRKEITRTIVQVRQRQAEKKKEQEILARQQREQKQAKSKSRDRGMDFDMGM